jgi:hypothetical protein
MGAISDDPSLRPKLRCKLNGSVVVPAPGEPVFISESDVMEGTAFGSVRLPVPSLPINPLYRNPHSCGGLPPSKPPPEPSHSLFSWRASAERPLPTEPDTRLFELTS